MHCHVPRRVQAAFSRSYATHRESQIGDLIARTTRRSHERRTVTKVRIHGEHVHKALSKDLTIVVVRCWCDNNCCCSLLMLLKSSIVVDVSALDTAIEYRELKVKLEKSAARSVYNDWRERVKTSCSHSLCWSASFQPALIHCNLPHLSLSQSTIAYSSTTLQKQEQKARAWKLLGKRHNTSVGSVWAL